MQRYNKLYALITTSRGETLFRVEVRDEAEALEKARENDGIFFRTFEVPTSIICGKRMEGEPFNFSAPRIVSLMGHQPREEASFIPPAAFSPSSIST